MSNPNQHYTALIIQKILDAVGQQNHVFYNWLIQNDLFIEQYRQFAYDILGTLVWKQVYEQAGQTPDTLDPEAVLHLALGGYSVSGQRLRPLDRQASKNSVPTPDRQSEWAAFYLDEISYRHATEVLDTLIGYHQTHEADKYTFQKENTF